MKTAEDHIKDEGIKRDLANRDELKRARRRALVLASATVISLIFFMYGFIQKPRLIKFKKNLFKQNKNL